MRGLLVGVTVAVTLIAGAMAVSPVRAGGPEITADEALAELVFSGAPLAAPATTPPSSTGMRHAPSVEPVERIGASTLTA